jgi:CDP-diacylglycerol--serine O-phosphatidyltransferase
MPKRASRRRQGVSLLPSLFTTGNLFLGFASLVSGIGGHYTRAAALIYVAMLFDFVDGPLARLTGSSSDFGVEYDSLADSLSFGVAPAALAYLYALQRYDRYGWIVAFLFAAGAALRLGRYNTTTKPGKANTYFQGLSTPTASGTLGGLVLLSGRYGLDEGTRAALFFVAVPLLAFLMVSTLPYYSFKTVRLNRKQAFYATAGIAVGFAAIAAEPTLVLPLMFLAYAFSGPVLWLVRPRRRKQPSQEPHDEAPTPPAEP